MKLYDYQEEAVESLRQCVAHGNRRLLLQAPTGSGKTVIAANIIKNAEEKGKRVMFLAHRRELVHQCGDKLFNFGCDHGLIMSGEFLQMQFEVQVASIMTLNSWAIRNERMPMPKADIIFIDEAHRSMAPTYIEMINRYPEAVVIGMTATPCRTDGRGLGDIYDSMVCCPSVAELIERGFLVPIEYFAPTIPDLTGVKVTAGDYNQRELEKAMNQRELVGDVITHWHRLASDRPTVVFASGVDHSIHLRDEFVKAGVSAAHIDGEMSTFARDNVIKGLQSGDYQVVTNCMVLTEGFDMPELSACVLARPTKSLGLYLQMAGRALRTADGKKNMLMIDHSGNVYQHGFVEDPRDWTLSTSKALPKERVEDTKERVSKTITCVKCAQVYDGQLVCPSCGYKPERSGKYYETRHGELTRLKKKDRKTAKKKSYTISDKKKWYRMFRFIADERGFKPGWAAHKYRTKFEVWPVSGWSNQDYIETPTPECRSYIRHLNIKSAKAREAEQRGRDNSRAVSG